MMNDRLYMTQALALAERGRGRTSPNPVVGAVIVDPEGVVVGRGFHERAGGPHAEVRALADAGPRCAGATLYCTLEPCSHVGRTGPCAPLVAASGVRRAVIAVQDPNPAVAGSGIALLRERGLDVSVGVLEAEARALNAPFFSVMQRGRPFVTMKIALSRDGKVAARRGIRTPLTGAAANRYVHRERAEVDAVGIGSGTVLIDDPLLTPRGAHRSRPLARVIFDRRLRTPPAARVLRTLDAGPIIVLAPAPGGAHERSRAEGLRRAGAHVEAVEPSPPRSFLQAALERLPGLGIGSIVVEGGTTLHEALWTAGLVDRVEIFRSRVILGPDGIPWLDGEVASVLTNVRTERLGDDLMIEGYVHGAD